MSNTAALTIRTDQKTKKAIADFATSIGLSTSAFATAILMQAVRDGRLVLTPALKPTPYLEEVMRTADKDMKNGKNISKAYDNVDDFFSEPDED